MVGTRLREGHYGQRPCAPHQQVKHMAAPTNAHCIKKTLANGEPSTWRKADTGSSRSVPPRATVPTSRANKSRRREYGIEPLMAYYAFHECRAFERRNWEGQGWSKAVSRGKDGRLRVDYAIQKRDVTALLTQTSRDGRAAGRWDRSGRCDARATVEFFNWYVANYRSNDFRSPIFSGMRRGKPVRRERSLSDQELRTMRRILREMGVYGAVVQCALLTAQRFRKVSRIGVRSCTSI